MGDEELPKIRYYFRCLRADSLIASKFEEQFPDATVRQRRGDPHGNSVASIQIIDTAHDLLDKLAGFVAETGLSSADCDLFISVLTTSDTMIVSVPERLATLSRQTECQITFSFTVV